jgi:hypothetical protein
MPADLDQFGREYSHGAVVGGKGFIKLGHMAPDARRLFDQAYLKTGRGKIKRGLNTADPSTNNHYIPEITLHETFTGLFNLIFFHFSPSLLLILRTQPSLLSFRRKPESRYLLDAGLNPA